MTDIPTYHVLALSGGGYRGLYTATVLAELEAVLGRPIASHFDLICGTSAGGMLALGLERRFRLANSKHCSKTKVAASLAAAAFQGGFWDSG